MKWLLRLFGSAPRREFAEKSSAATEEVRSNSAKKPRRKRRANEEVLADQKRIAGRLRKQGAASFRQERAQARRVGSRSYIWRSVGDSDVCSVCVANNGKQFNWNVSPPHGHPGEGECSTNGYCRCYAEVVLP